MNFFDVPHSYKGTLVAAQPSRRLTTFDLTLITISSIIGSGIFRTPSVVAARAHLAPIIVGCWLAGGVIALIGAFVFAELAARRPLAGGLYAYLRDAYHPMIGFLFGWTLLLLSGSGANAAAAVLFAGYLDSLTGLLLDPRVVVVVTFAVLATINILGVRQGSNWQNLVAVLKIGALAVIIIICFAGHPHALPHAAYPPFNQADAMIGAIAVAMLPVLFSYSGFQWAGLITAETMHPERTIPKALVIGVSVVVVIYLLANIGYLRILGASQLSATATPASDAIHAVIGDLGSRFIALAIALSTLGYLSACMLTFPRVYYQMAADGLFFKHIGGLSRTSNAPAAAILLQALLASIIAVSGTYAQIINWVVFPQWLFIFLAAGAVFIFRRRDKGLSRPPAMVPGHPITTALFIAVLLAIFVAEFLIYPNDTRYGILVLVAGTAAYYVWQRISRAGA
jgi:basic amino acid/polyamine antiporter, APA family